MAPKSVTFRCHDHLVSVLFGDLLSQSYNITFSMFLYLVTVVFADFACHSYTIPDTVLLLSGGDLRPPSPVICKSHEL